MAHNIVDYVRLDGIPHNIKENALIKAFAQHCEERHLDDVIEECLKARIFKPATLPAFAIIWGLDTNYEWLRYHFGELRINGQKVSLTKDDGFPRLKNGELMASIGRQQLEAYATSVKASYQLVPFVTNSELGMPAFPDFIYKKLVKMSNENVSALQVGALAKIPESGLYQFSSVMRTIQALFRWSNQLITINLRDEGIVITTFIQLMDPKGEWKCNLNYGYGIGLNKAMVDFHEKVFLHGFVPLSSLDDKIVDAVYYNSIESKCKFCGQRFEIVGLDRDLLWAAGICGCSYRGEFGRNRYLRGETFARLILVKMDDDEKGALRWIPLSDRVKMY